MIIIIITGNLATVVFHFEQNPVHVYNSPGTYNVCLTLSDSNTNCNSTFCKSIEIPYENPNCQADFYYEPQIYPLEIQFYDASTGVVSLWMWDFGDGLLLNNKIRFMTFPQEGVYEFALIF